LLNLLDGVFNLELQQNDIEKIYRLGSWSEGNYRPLLVSFKNLDMKEDIMSNVRNLKNPIEKFRGIGISQDLPPKERKEIKRILDDSKQRHIADCDEDVENFRFIVVGKGDRRRVIKIKKTIPSSTNQSKPPSTDPPALTAV